jgi:Domain of unknown function (DUF4105)
MTETLHEGWAHIHQVEAVVSFDPEQKGVCSIAGVRNITYHGEEFANYNLAYLTEIYDVNQLGKVWFMENNYGKAQSHIMMTFQFGVEKFLTISVEVRKKTLADFEVWHVLYKTFHVFYIFATEYDLLYLRTNIRNSPTYLYELELSDDQQKALFIEICNSVQRTYQNNLIYKVFVRWVSPLKSIGGTGRRHECSIGVA